MRVYIIIIEMDIEKLIKQEDVSCYGCGVSLLPALILEKDQGKVYVFSSEKHPELISNQCVQVNPNWNISNIREQNEKICFLDYKATKVLFAKFPSKAQFIFVRFAPRTSWLVALPGLLRHIYTGRVSINQIVKLKTGNSYTRWLVLKNNRVRPMRERQSLSLDMGVRGFLDHLKKEKVKYVVLRFYEDLPDLKRVDGDLDILVADEDEEKIKIFLTKHPGPIKIDLWPVSRKFDDIVYYPPPLARKILESAIDGPAGSRIPAPKEAFLSLAYHALYHKGVGGVFQAAFSPILRLKFRTMIMSEHWPKWQKILA